MTEMAKWRQISGATQESFGVSEMGINLELQHEEVSHSHLFVEEAAFEWVSLSSRGGVLSANGYTPMGKMSPVKLGGVGLLSQVLTAD